MKIFRRRRDSDPKVVLNSQEARQAEPGPSVRYVLIFGILGVVVCFAVILVAFTQTN